MNQELKNKLFLATFFDKNKNLSILVNTLNDKKEGDIRILPLDKIHITWKFIGDIDSNENEKVFNIIQSHAFIIKNCTLTFDKLEVWPSLRHPRLLTLTARKYDKKFAEFFNAIEESLHEDLKTEKEKGKFIPHITLARTRSGKTIRLLKKIELKPIKLRIKYISAAQSINSKNGVEYKILYKESF